MKVYRTDITDYTGEWRYVQNSLDRRPVVIQFDNGVGEVAEEDVARFPASFFELNSFSFEAPAAPKKAAAKKKTQD